VSEYWLPVFGFFFGFAFGVGCALAVMYSIYMGGYRAALSDSRLPSPPARYHQALSKLDARKSPDR
jgi:hypothetical protein